MKKILPLTLLALVLSACLPQNVTVPQSPLLPVLERKSGLIAYVGNDGNVYLTDQSGRSPDALTDDAVLPEDNSNQFTFYQYPTWSADGTQVAYVRVHGAGGSQSSSEMFVHNIADEATTKVYSSESEHPVYLYWSPDNQNVSFLSTSSAGQALILQSVSAQGGEREILDAGSPYYWSWAPDGSTMIVHTGSADSTSPEHLAFLQVDSGIIEDGLDSMPASFQSPAWSPDGSRILLTRLSDSGENEIVLANSAGEFEKSIAKFDLNTAFVWSPDSQLVAYIEGTEPLDAGALGTMHVMDLNTSEDFFQAENVLAFFWSPDNRKLAYFLPVLVDAQDQSGQQVLLLEMHMLDVVSGESKELFTFQPTNQFSGILPYFDQYHQSATIWSPNSDNIVLSFVSQDGSPGIAIVAPSGQLEPRIIAAGFIAFWSWK